MSERVHAQRPSSRSDEEEVHEQPAADESAEALKTEIDSLLDEIDDILETNAEDFVAAYVQKGGQ